MISCTRSVSAYIGHGLMSRMGNACMLPSRHGRFRWKGCDGGGESGDLTRWPSISLLGTSDNKLGEKILES